MEFETMVTDLTPTDIQESLTAIFHSPNQALDLQSLPIPNLKKGEILVQNEYTTLCSNDLHIVEGKRQEKTPTILGHEIVGTIVAFGPDADRQDMRWQTLSIGDRVSWAIYASDPSSKLAQRGIPQKGVNLFTYGHEVLSPDNTLHGGLSQFSILRPHTPIAKIDPNIPLPVAATINCAMATVAGAFRLAGKIAGKRILISGSGMLGMIACAMAQTLGAATVVATDVLPWRIKRAQEFGADEGLLADLALGDRLTQLYGNSTPFDVLIELSGSPIAMEQTLHYLGIGGIAVWLGAACSQRDVQIKAESLIRNLHTIRGLHHYNEEDFVRAVNFIEQHYTDFPFCSLIGQEFSLSEINEAFAYAASRYPFRVGIRIDCP